MTGSEATLVCLTRELVSGTEELQCTAFGRQPEPSTQHWPGFLISFMVPQDFLALLHHNLLLSLGSRQRARSTERMVTLGVPAQELCIWWHSRGGSRWCTETAMMTRA